jgi:hypothetical protein
MDMELVKEILRDGLGKAGLELVTSFTVPLFWMMWEGGGLRVRSGSAFFLDAGAAVRGHCRPRDHGLATRPRGTWS